MNKLLILCLFWLFAVPAMAQKEEKSLTIQTSTVCDMCKDRIERQLVFEKGVKEVHVDLEQREIHVKYREDKTTPDKIREAVTRIGYDADDRKADPKAFARLPKCCREEGQHGK